MLPLASNTVGQASGAFPVAFNMKGGGKSESFWLAGYDDVLSASIRAGEALSLEIKEKRIEEDQAFFSFQEGKGKRVDLLIERRTDTMTSIQFNVGWYGSRALNRLMGRQIILELEEADAFLEDWIPEKHN
jgi:hypothetical protein